jgi:hypothetical protein
MHNKIKIVKKKMTLKMNMLNKKQKKKDKELKLIFCME